MLFRSLLASRAGDDRNSPPLSFCHNRGKKETTTLDRRNTMPDKVPNGFLNNKQAAQELGCDPNDWDFCSSLPCRLCTDNNGANLFIIEVNGEKHFLPVRTD